MKLISFCVEKTKTGYCAYADDLPIYTTGSDISELENNILEAINIYQQETGGLALTLKDLTIQLALNGPDK